MFYVSAGVYSTEKDISEIVPAVATTTAALVGYSARGNPDRIVTCTTNQQFIAEYGNPDIASGSFFHTTALAYLEKGTSIKCLRVHNGALYGGVDVAYGAGTTAPFVSGRSTKQFGVGSSTPANTLFDVYAKDPGQWNSTLAIGIRYTVPTGDPLALPTGPLTVIPNSLDDKTNYNFWVDVYTIADSVYTLVESFYVSRKHKLNGYGQQMYLETAINGISKYIYVYNSTVADTTMPKTTWAITPTRDVPITLGPTTTLNGTTTLNSAMDAKIVLGWAEFLNPDVVDFRVAIQGGAGSDYTVVQTAMKSVVEARKDCMAVLDIPYASTVTPDAMVTFRQTQNFNSSYTALYGPWVKIFDPYSGQIQTVPPSGFVAAQYAHNDDVANVWTAPAGTSRGQLNVLGMNYVFSQGERDLLYATPTNVNPLQTFMGLGNVVWGQKTQQARASALDRVNVRRLLIVLEKSISASLVGFVFENNNLITRTRIQAMIDSYLSVLNAGGAFTTVNGEPGYRVVCDESNNTPAIIDQHIIAVDVFVKPAQAGEFIRLQTIITTSGASFEELIAQGV